MKKATKLLESLSSNQLCIISVLLLAFVPYFILCLYANPIADDFTYAAEAKDGEFLKSVLRSYNEWSGRYTANFMALFNPISFNNFALYKAIPALLIVLTPISIYTFIESITNHYFSRKKKVIISLLLTLLYLHQMPHIAEGIYWYTGAIIYHLSALLFLVYNALLIPFYRKTYLFKSRFIHIILLIATLFFTIGCNEVIMLFLLLESVILSLKTYKNKSDFSTSLTLSALTVAFICLSYFAPGNSARSEEFNNNHQCIYSTGMSLAQTVRFLLEWISSVPLLLVSVLYVFINKSLSSKVPLFKHSFYLSPIQVTLLLLSTIFIASFLPYWATGILGQHRTINLAYFVFMFLWFISLTVYSNHLSVYIPLIPHYIKTGIYILIISTLFFTKNGYHAVDDLISKKAKDYDEIMNERYVIIDNACDTVLLKQIEVKPKCLFVLDISEDPEYWINQSYNLYFNTKHPIVGKK